MDIDERKIGEWPNVALIPGTHIHAATGEHVEQPENTRIGHHRNVDDMDTREKLEADVDRMVKEHGLYWLRTYIIEWLDRKAAITKRECMERATSERIGWDCAECAEGLGKRIAELTAERDLLDQAYTAVGEACTDAEMECECLRDKVDELIVERDELREKNSRQRRQLGKLQDAIHERNEGVLKRQWQHRINELTAERDHLKNVVKVQANSFAKLEQKLAVAKSRLEAMKQ